MEISQCSRELLFVKRRDSLSLQALRKNLLEEAEDSFPDEIEAYRGIRNQSSAVSTFITDFHRD